MFMQLWRTYSLQNNFVGLLCITAEKCASNQCQDINQATFWNQYEPVSRNDKYVQYMQKISAMKWTNVQGSVPLFVNRWQQPCAKETPHYFILWRPINNATVLTRDRSCSSPVCSSPGRGRCQIPSITPVRLIQPSLEHTTRHMDIMQILSMQI